MKKMKYIMISLLLVLAVSCDTSLPMPIVGSYRVSDFKEQSEAYYHLSLREDRTFTLYQWGGSYSAEPFVFTGKWDASLTAFDFKKAEGILRFTEVEGPAAESVTGLVLTAGQENNYRFFWSHDLNNADASLSLKSMNKYYCKDISTGFKISDEEFGRVTGNKEAEV